MILIKKCHRKLWGGKWLVGAELRCKRRDTSCQAAFIHSLSEVNWRDIYTHAWTFFLASWPFWSLRLHSPSSGDAESVERSFGGCDLHRRFIHGLAQYFHRVLLRGKALESPEVSRWISYIPVRRSTWRHRLPNTALTSSPKGLLKGSDSRGGPVQASLPRGIIPKPNKVRTFDLHQRNVSG